MSLGAGERGRSGLEPVSEAHTFSTLGHVAAVANNERRSLHDAVLVAQLIRALSKKAGAGQPRRSNAGGRLAHGRPPLTAIICSSGDCDCAAGSAAPPSIGSEAASKNWETVQRSGTGRSSVPHNV